MADDACWPERRLGVGRIVWCICLSVSPHTCLFQTGSGFHRPFLSLLLLCFFDETALFVLFDRLNGLFRSVGLWVAMAVHVEWVVLGKRVGETCRLLVFPFGMVWKEWESLFLKPIGGGFEALSGRFLGHLECMWMVEGPFGRDGRTGWKCAEKRFGIIGKPVKVMVFNR